MKTLAILLAEVGKFMSKKGSSLQQAILFWKFVQEIQIQEGWKIKRLFLKEFVAHENYLIPIIAQIESFPVSIWRRILWRYNINFESHDMFLSRLGSEEIKHIIKNYNDMFILGEQPRALTWFERRLKRFRFENLIVEKDNQVLRNASKGSWSYNLGNLGFGFNAFSGKVRTTVKTWRAFVSIKNHADDFVVNQECGIYWWLYRTARSSYGWRLNHTVQLKDHICPGFWWTMTVHFVFWILSPVMFTVCVIYSNWFYTQVPLLLPLPIYIVGLITPLWIVSAIIQSLFSWLWLIIKCEMVTWMFNWVEDQIEALKPSNNKVSEWIVICFECVIALAVVVLALIFFYLITIEIASYLSPTLGIICTIVVLTAAYLYVISCIYVECEYGRYQFSRHHIIFKIIYAGAGGWLLVKFYIEYEVLILSLLALSWQMLVLIGQIFLLIGITPTLFLVFLLGIPILFVIAINLYDKRIEKKPLKFEAFVKWTERLIFCFLGAFLLYVIVATYYALSYQSLKYVVGIFLSELIVALVLYRLVMKIIMIDPELNRCEAWSNEEGNRLQNFIFVSGSLNRFIMKWLLFRNKAYHYLSEGKRKYLFSKVYEVIGLLTGVSYRDTFYLLLPVMTKELLDRMVHELKVGVPKSSLRFSKKLKILRMVIKGMSFADAQAIILKKRAVRRKKIEKIMDMVATTLYPFILFGRNIVKVWELLKALKWLYVKFNQMCPYVQQSQLLTIDTDI